MHTWKKMKNYQNVRTKVSNNQIHAKMIRMNEKRMTNLFIWN